MAITTNNSIKVNAEAKNFADEAFRGRKRTLALALLLMWLIERLVICFAAVSKSQRSLAGVE